jgi:ABC-2 type transport system permease protein
MIAGALFYYQRHWWRNRLLMRIRRLRQPKYLFGAIVGGLYFYWYFFRNLSRGGRGVRIAPENLGMAQSIAALVLFVMVLLAWILPHARAALAFTEAEVAFLFPAPIGRRTLLHFKLLKSQFVILLSAVFMTCIGRAWGGGNLVIRVLGWWVVFATLNLHMLGSSFFLTRLMDRGLSNWLRRILILGAVGAVAAGFVFWLHDTVPPPPMVQGSTDFSWLGRYANEILQSGPLPYVLFPFRLVVAPYFAANAGQFLLALGPALAVMGLHYWWVMRSNVAFEEASVELSRKMAERMAAMRSGNWQAAQKPKKARRPPFRLRPAGRPAIALFWKNLISAGNLVTARVWLFLVWFAVVGGFALQMAKKQAGGMGTGLVVLALGLAALSLFWGPQMLRNDLRQDLPATDVLKMFPMPGWQVVLGEVLAPAAMLAGMQWLLLLVAVFLFPNHFGEYSFAMGARIGFALAAAIVLPCVDLIAMLIPNAAVLFFPAWFQLGKETPRGFETMGQQLILMFGQLFILILSLAPAAAAFTIIFLPSSYYLHVPVAGVLLGSMAAAALLLLEAGLGIKMLGAVFERFDLSSEVLQQG